MKNIYNASNPDAAANALDELEKKCLFPYR